MQRFYRAIRSKGAACSAAGGRFTQRSRVGPLLTLAVLAVSIGGLTLWGRQLPATGARRLGTGLPWFGKWGWTVPASTWIGAVVCGALAVALVTWWPVLCRRLPVRWLPLAAAVASFGWTVVLSTTRGFGALQRAILHDAEYFAAVGQVGSPGQFLARYTDDLATFPIHVQGHPPGQVLLLWTLDQVGLTGPGPAAMQTIAFGALAVGCVLVVARWEAGPDAARQAAVFAGLTPSVWTVATSSDATFSGLCATAVLLAFAAERSRRTTTQVPLALAAGGLGALCCYFTYAAPLFLAPAIVPAWRMVWRRRVGWAWTVTAALVGAAAVVGVFTAAGFAWWDGLAATLDTYHGGLASQRPYRYFILANLVVFAVMVGPAVLVGWQQQRLAPGLVPLVAAAAGAVLVADLTGLSKGEIERIWLPFVPWVALAAAPLASNAASARRWLAAQLAVALVLQLTFLGPW